MAKAILNTVLGTLATSVAVMGTTAPIASAQGFINDFAPEQWELFNSRPASPDIDTAGGIPIAPYNGSVDFSNAPDSLTLLGSDQTGILTELGYDCSSAPSDLLFLCDISITTVFVTVPEAARISFNWDYVTTDIDGPAFDLFGYVVDDFPPTDPRTVGIFNQLSDSNGGAQQSGIFMIPELIEANQILGLQIGTDNLGGRAQVTISNLRVMVTEADEVEPTAVPEPTSGIAIAILAGLGLGLRQTSPLKK